MMCYSTTIKWFHLKAKCMAQIQLSILLHTAYYLDSLSGIYSFTHVLSWKVHILTRTPSSRDALLGIFSKE